VGGPTSIARCQDGPFIAPVKGLPGLPDEGHSLAKVLADLEAQIGLDFKRHRRLRRIKGAQHTFDQRSSQTLLSMRRGFRRYSPNPRNPHETGYD